MDQRSHIRSHTLASEAEGGVSNAIATTLGVAAAVCALIPGVGPIIAAILLIIAAIIILISQIVSKEPEEKAAAKEKEALANPKQAAQTRSRDLNTIWLTAGAVLFVLAMILVRYRETRDTDDD